MRTANPVLKSAARLFVRILPSGAFFAGLAFLLALAQVANAQAIVNAQAVQARQAAQNSAKLNSAVQKIEKQRKFLLTSAIASGLAGGWLLKTSCCPSSAPCSVPDTGGGGGPGTSSIELRPPPAEL